MSDTVELKLNSQDVVLVRLALIEYKHRNDAPWNTIAERVNPIIEQTRRLCPLEKQRI